MTPGPEVGLVKPVPEPGRALCQNVPTTDVSGLGTLAGRNGTDKKRAQSGYSLPQGRQHFGILCLRSGRLVIIACVY